MATAVITQSGIGMNLYFERLVKGPQFKLAEEMVYEGVRLKSFKTWPNWGPVWPTLLAKAGFYFTGSADQVACFSCNGRLKTWESGDSPMSEHKRFFPQCRFITRRDTRNVPLGDAAESPPVTCSGQASRCSNTNAPSNYYNCLASYAGATGRNDRPSRSLVANTQVHEQAPQRAQHESLSGTSTTDGLVGRHSRGMLSGGTPLVTDRSFNMEQLQELKVESRRLDSYADWPTSAFVSKESLAKAGLYYLGNGDRVKCAFCNGILRNWEQGDEPMDEHRKFFRNCAFLADARAAGNITIEEETLNSQQASQNVVANSTPGSELGIVMERPIHQNYAIEADRLATFRQWPLSSPQNPETLASAGFFYTGFGDNVKCFYCDGGLRNWELGDDVWTEHARWFPRCNFVKTVKGQDFIIRTQTAYTGQGVTIPTGHAVARSTAASSTGRGRFPVEPRAVRARMDTTTVQVVLQMGYTHDLLYAVIENRLATVGDDFPNVQSLLEAVFAAEETRSSSLSSQQSSIAAEPAASSGAATASYGTTAASNVSAAASSGAASSGTASSGAAAASSIMSEPAGGKSKNLKKKKKNKGSGKVAETSTPPSEPETKPVTLDDQRLQCKICMDDEAKILFLPCGHLCCCPKCAPALRNCPICRAVVRGTVRVYLP